VLTNVGFGNSARLRNYTTDIDLRYGNPIFILSMLLEQALILEAMDSTATRIAEVQSFLENFTEGFH
jgi:hypothetical protein